MQDSMDEIKKHPSLNTQQKRNLLMTFCKQQVVKAKIQRFINTHKGMSKEQQMLYIAEHINEFRCNKNDISLIKQRINVFEETYNK